jgi:cytidylate kinase
MVEEPDLAIWLDAPLDVRAERVADREQESVATARDRIAERAESEATRYHQIHGIDIADLSIYDLVIDTATWGEDAVNDLVALAVERLDG